jgi:hypothetical protein
MNDKIFEELPQLDHVALCVRSMQDAKKFYGEQLAFTIFPEGKHPEYGTRNCGIWFKDNTYVELLTFLDKEKASWLSDFLANNEGCLFFVLKVTSVDSIAQNLRDAGFNIQEPQTGTIEYEGDLPIGTSWKTLFLPPTFSLGKMIIFIEYTSSDKAEPPFHKYSEHENSATRLSKVFIATKDLDKMKNDFENLGFKIGPEREIEEFDAISRKFSLGNKTQIVLLSPASNNDGSLQIFLEKRGDGIFGFSIQVKNFYKILTTMSRKFLGLAIGTEGKNKIWIPPQVSHGAWIEIYQK